MNLEFMQPSFETDCKKANGDVIKSYHLLYEYQISLNYLLYEYLYNYYCDLSIYGAFLYSGLHENQLCIVY